MAEARYLDDGTFDAVIFDKDGTLLDFQRTWGSVIGGAIRTLAESDEQASMIATALGFDLDTFSFAADSVVIAESNEVVAAHLAAAAPGVDLRAFEAEVLAASQGAAVARDGAAELLAALATCRIPVAVATNDAAEAARRQLDGLGWGDRFVAVIGYDSGFGAKPDPAMVTAAVASTGALAHRTAMVGDSSHDIDAGRAAGLVTIYVGTDAAVAATADIAVDHLTELSQFTSGRR